MRLGCGAVVFGGLKTLALAESGRVFVSIMMVCTILAAGIGLRFGDRGFTWMLQVLGWDGWR